MRRSKASTGRRSSRLDPLSWSLFATLVISLFFKRLIDTVGTVFARDCDETPIYFMGPAGPFDGPMEWLLVIGLCAATVLIVQAIGIVLAKQASLIQLILWLVNMSLAALLVWSYLIAWAFFNPAEKYAHPIFQFTANFVEHQDYMTPEAVSDRQHQSFGDWIWHEDIDAYINEPIGLMWRNETVRTCGPAELRRGQLKLIYGRRYGGQEIDDIPVETLRKPVSGDVLYDLQGNYLMTLGGPYYTTSTITRARDAAYDKNAAAMSPEEAERRFWASLKAGVWQRPAANDDFPERLKEEIDQIVAENWGDASPSWGED